MTHASDEAAPARRRSAASGDWCDTFIAALGDTSNIRSAARAADIDPSRAYRRRRDDPDFARRWFAALCEGYDNLEMELLHRLRIGTLEKPGKDVARRKYDTATAFKLLLAHRETVSWERARKGSDDEGAILAAINAKIETMRQREREIAAGTVDEADDF